MILKLFTSITFYNIVELCSSKFYDIKELISDKKNNMGVGYRRQGGTCPSNVEEKGYVLAPSPPFLVQKFRKI